MIKEIVANPSRFSEFALKLSTPERTQLYHKIALILHPDKAVAQAVNMGLNPEDTQKLILSNENKFKIIESLYHEVKNKPQVNSNNTATAEEKNFNFFHVSEDFIRKIPREISLRIISLTGKAKDIKINEKTTLDDLEELIQIKFNLNSDITLISNGKSLREVLTEKNQLQTPLLALYDQDASIFYGHVVRFVHKLSPSKGISMA